MTTDISGFAAPIITSKCKVPDDWIDYNGHMNVSYYSMAFDQAIDEVFETVLEIGESHTAKTRHGPYVLQNNMHYLDELLVGAEFRVNFRLIDHDAKRMHLFLEMINTSGVVVALSEQLLMNVDLTTRRSTPYPEWVQGRLAQLQTAHDVLPLPPQLGAALGIRRKG